MFTAPFSLPKTARLFPKRRLYTDPSAQLCRASDCQLLAPLPPRYHSRRRKGTAYLSSESLSPRGKKKSKYNYKRRGKKKNSRAAGCPRKTRERPSTSPAGSKVVASGGPGASCRRGARARRRGAPALQHPPRRGQHRPRSPPRQTDGPTDGRTDGRTDRPTERAAQLGPARPRPAPQGARPPPFVAGGAGLGSQLRARRSPPRKDAGGPGRHTEPPGLKRRSLPVLRRGGGGKVLISRGRGTGRARRDAGGSVREIPAAPSKLAAGVLRLSSPPAAPAESTDLPPRVSASCGTRGKSTRRWDWGSQPCIPYHHLLRLYGGEQAPGDEQTTNTEKIP